MNCNSFLCLDGNSGKLKIILRKNIGIGVYEQCFSLFNEHKFIELTWQVK